MLGQQLAEPPSFALPRTTLISEVDQIERYDELLRDALLADSATTEFTHHSRCCGEPVPLVIFPVFHHARLRAQKYA